MGAEERGARARAGASGALQHFRRNDPGPTSNMDHQPMEGDVRLSELANRMDGYIEGCFIHQVDPKDGYAIGDCRNGRQHRILEFIVPIIHLDKPTRVTITIGNTIFGALDGGREVDWGVVFGDLAQRLAKGVGKPKPTPICSFLFHLYVGQGLLTEDKELDYRTAKEMAGYRITPDPDSRPGSDDKGAAPTLAA